jgi:hypothetical protein
MKFIAIIILILSIHLISAKLEHKCIHDQIKYTPEFVDTETDSNLRHGRNLQTAAPIRITYDFTNLTATVTNNAALLKTLQTSVTVGAKFYSDFLSLTPESAPIKPTATCY